MSVTLDRLVAQWESASLTQRRSAVRNRPSLPLTHTGERTTVWRRATSQADRRLRLRSLAARDAASLYLARHGPGGEAALPVGARGDRPRDRGRLLLRLRQGGAVHARGPREDRRGHAGDREGGSSLRAPGDVARRGDRLLPRAWRAVQGRDPRGHRRPARVALPPGRLHRSLPWPARGVDRSGEAFQAPLVLWRLLARRRAESDAPADLRHRLADAGGARQASLAARGGEEARPSEARARARSVRAPRRLAGRALLASERLDGRARAGTLRAGSAGRAGLPGRLHAEPRQQAALGAIAAPGPLFGQHVHGRGRGAALQPQADELSGVHARLPSHAALVPRPSAALRRHGAAAPERALRHPDGAPPRPAVHAGRRPHLLPARSAPGRDHGDARAGARLVQDLRARGILQAVNAPGEVPGDG